jgi:hypothetical protein
MNKWIYLHRKLVITIIVLLFLLILLLRVFLFSEVDANGNPDKTALIRSFFDSLMATILVTASVSITLLWLKHPYKENLIETLIQPFQIDDALRKGLQNSTEWYYCGHTGRYIRSQILPALSRDSLARNENKHVKVIILNPCNINVCDFYAIYRNHSRSNNKKSQWSKKRVQSELLATILCLIELQQSNSMIEVQAGLIETVSLFRIDFSSTMALVTQEDNQEPAIMYSNESHFYRCYRREIELVWKQCNQLDYSNFSCVLDYSDLDSIKTCLKEVGISVNSFSDDILNQAVIQAQKKASPYVSK